MSRAHRGHDLSFFNFSRNLFVVSLFRPVRRSRFRLRAVLAPLLLQERSPLFLPTSIFWLRPKPRVALSTEKKKKKRGSSALDGGKGVFDFGVASSSRTSEITLSLFYQCGGGGVVVGGGGSSRAGRP